MEETIKLNESLAGSHISSVCQKASALANKERKSVRFAFNETDVIVKPGDTPESAEAAWAASFEAKAKAYRESPEYKRREKEREEEHARKLVAHLTEAAQTEAEMREAKVPWPYTPSQLAEYIESLVNRSHDYGTCVYAMSLAATAAFNYIAHKLNATGFQSSCADLDVIRRSRSIKGPFMLIKGEDALYPQYDLPRKLQEALAEWTPWLKEEAAKKLAETNETNAHPDVIAHWEQIVSA